MKRIAFLLIFLMLPTAYAQLGVLKFQADEMYMPMYANRCCLEALEHIENETLKQQIIGQSYQDPVCCNYAINPSDCFSCFQDEQDQRQKILEEQEMARQRSQIYLFLLLGFLALLPIILVISVANLVVFMVRKKGFLPLWLAITFWVILALPLFVALILSFITIASVRTYV